jgi:hypothetical protein
MFFRILALLVVLFAVAYARPSYGSVMPPPVQPGYGMQSGGGYGMQTGGGYGMQQSGGYGMGGGKSFFLILRKLRPFSIDNLIF